MLEMFLLELAAYGGIYTVCVVSYKKFLDWLASPQNMSMSGEFLDTLQFSQSSLNSKSEEHKVKWKSLQSDCVKSANRRCHQNVGITANQTENMAADEELLGFGELFVISSRQCKAINGQNSNNLYFDVSSLGGEV